MRSQRVVEKLCFILALAASGMAAGPAEAALLLPAGFALEKVKGDLKTPTAVAFAPDGRIFYLEKGAGSVGRVRVIVNGEIASKEVLKITNLGAGFEVGMLGLALDPNFSSNHFFYVFYTQDDSSGGVVIEPTWRSIQDNLFGAACLGCHGVGPAAGLQLFESNSYQNLVNVASTQVPSLKRVKPGDPDNSYLVMKLEDAAGIVGNRMPPGGAPVDQATLDAVREWIEDGAPQNSAAPISKAGSKALALGPDARNRVVRYKEVGGVAQDPLVLLDYIPAAGFHNAGVLEFAPDGTLLIQTGENGGDGMLAQDGQSLAGKILRINSDGTVPANNPYVSDPNVRDEVFSMGHRNGFGLAPDTLRPSPLRVFVSENGPDHNDELNVSAAGLNFGWPMYQGMEGPSGYTWPILTWSPTVAPTGVALYTGAPYGATFNGNLFLGRYNLDNGNAVIERVQMNAAGTAVTSSSVFLDAPLGSNGYIMDVLQGPDGLVHFTTGDALFRIALDADADGCGNSIDPAPNTFSPDVDNDGFGSDCDCAPTKKGANPSRTEVPGNGVDDDCDPSTPPAGSCPGPTTLDPGARPEFFGWANAALYFVPGVAILLILRRRRAR